MWLGLIWVGSPRGGGGGVSLPTTLPPTLHLLGRSLARVLDLLESVGDDEKRYQTLRGIAALHLLPCITTLLLCITALHLLPCIDCPAVLRYIYYAALLPCIAALH